MAKILGFVKKLSHVSKTQVIRENQPTRNLEHFYHWSIHTS